MSSPVPEQPYSEFSRRIWDRSARACGGGRCTFRIDAYGRLQLCSNNCPSGYDLRTVFFQDGSYQALPAFPCP